MRGRNAKSGRRGPGRGGSRHTPKAATGQMVPLPGREDSMVANNAGGFIFKVANAQQLRRFLVLGAAGGTYYVGERELILENALHIKGMILSGEGREVVETVLDFSVNARTPKQDTLTFTLALAYSFGDKNVRSLVFQHLAAICRIPTTLFSFLEFVKHLGNTNHAKSGRGLRTAIGKWYNGVTEDVGEAAVRQAFTCTKYKNRNGWTHQDVLKVFHVKPKCQEAALLFKYLTQPWKKVAPEFAAYLSQLDSYAPEAQDDNTSAEDTGAEIEASADKKLPDTTDQKADSMDEDFVMVACPAPLLTETPELTKTTSQADATPPAGTATPAEKTVLKEEVPLVIGVHETAASAESKTLAVTTAQPSDATLSSEEVLSDEAKEKAEKRHAAKEARELVRQRKRARIEAHPVKVASQATMTRLAQFLTDLEGITPISECNEENEDRVVATIKKWMLAREQVPSPLLNSKAVWEALLEEMPMTAMMRNLAKMTSVGLIAPLSDASATIAKRLKNANALKREKIHPFNVLLALRTYQSGRGVKGKLEWEPDQMVVAALEDAYYLSFQAVEPTGKRFLLALDVSGSMSFPMNDSPMSCREASAALSMVTARTEENCHFFGFCDQFVPLNITRNDTLTQVETKISNLPFGRTDCSLPMVYALQQKISVDVFVVYTDNETYTGRVQPVTALASYRKEINSEAKLVVVGMTATQFTIADPEDPGMMDIVGFDSGALQAMGEFVSGKM
ncbi:60 kDa SS-A/Ro ribonucleoprotein [Gonapodya sp. JEL0774]|nr:60 kDa SS-A/Ro ribonucleoprotein [Gonapodya sp. JEL0774]